MLKTGALFLAAALAASAPTPNPDLSRPPLVQNYAAKAGGEKKRSDNYQRDANKASAVGEPGHAVKTQKNSTAATTQKPKGWFDGWSVGDKIALIVAIIGFFQFLALVATYCVMDRTAKRQLRAYVAAVPSFIFSFDKDTEPRARVRWANSGVTPAFKLRHRSKIELLAYPYHGGDGLPPVDGDWSAPMVLFPGTEFFGVKTREKKFSDAEIALIESGAARIHVYGEVKYLDIHKTGRKTLFCYAVAADEATLRKLTDRTTKDDFSVSFEVAPMGNDAT